LRIFARHLQKDITTYKVPYGKVWEISGGEVNHITGTDTYLSVLDNQGFSWCDVVKVAGATASGAFNINDEVQTNFVIRVNVRGLLIPAGFRLQVGGGAGVNSNLWIKEYNEDEL